MGKSQKRKDSDCKTLISPQEETIKMTTRLEAHLHSIVPNSFMNRDKLYICIVVVAALKNYGQLVHSFLGLM